jgi:hypothetical protein
MFGLTSDKKLTPICRQDFVMRGQPLRQSCPGGKHSKNQHLLFEIRSGYGHKRKDGKIFYLKQFSIGLPACRQTGNSQ